MRQKEAEGVVNLHDERWETSADRDYLGGGGGIAAPFGLSLGAERFVFVGMTALSPPPQPRAVPKRTRAANTV